MIEFLNNPVNILMVGARRCGKSSVLASMIKQLSEDKRLYDLCTVEQSDTNEGGVPLSKKRNDLQSFIEKNLGGQHYLVDFNSDTDFSEYTLKINFKNTILDMGRIYLRFVDCPGEVWTNFGTSASKNPQKSGSDIRELQLRQYLKNADVLMIVIDTPYLMADGTDGGKFKNVNSTIEIKSLIQEYCEGMDADKKLKVIFVPVKCERWENELSNVNAKLQEWWRPMFDLLENRANVSYSIIPAITAGGIQFAEFSVPTLLNNRRCVRLGRSPFVRMEDGTTKELDTNDELIKDSEFLAFKQFPYYSWFRNNGNGYCPQNCDQIALHVLRFASYMMTDRSWLGRILAPSVKALREFINELEVREIIKDSGNGIENIRKIER